jgi:hypothetical protein
MAAGLIAAWLRARISGTFENIRELQSRYRLPVIGVVPEVGSPSGRLRQRADGAAFLLACLALALGCAGLLAGERAGLTAPVHTYLRSLDLSPAG